jgi:hypothetical protein
MDAWRRILETDATTDAAAESSIRDVVIASDVLIGIATLERSGTRIDVRDDDVDRAQRMRGRDRVMRWSLSTTTLVAGTPSSSTVAPATNPRPRMVIGVAPAVGPYAGSTERTSTSLASYRNVEGI